MSAAGYSDTPLWKKLGLKSGRRLLVIGAPDGWVVPDLPADVGTTGVPSLAADSVPAETILAFFSERAEIAQDIGALGDRVFPAGAVWIAWPRRAGGHESDIREQDIRDIALPLGLVDVKVAALDRDWSGLRLVWRKDRRHT
jgi:hypothetical protein